MDWLISGLFERDSLVLYFGDPGAFKTFWALDHLCCVATGTSHHGRAVKQGPAIYISGEGFNGIARRLAAWSIRHNVDLAEAPLYVSTIAAGIVDPSNLAMVIRAIEQNGEPPAYVVLDTIARNLGPGDENITADMSAFVAGCDQIRATFGGCALGLVHHSGHGDKSRARGSSVLNGAVDATYRLTRDPSANVIRVDNTKAKDFLGPEPFAFEVRTVELGFKNEDGTEATSAVLHPCEFPKAQPRPSGKWQIKALAILERMTDEHQGNVAASGRDPVEARVRLTDWRDRCIEDGIPRQRWYEAKQTLSAAKQVHVDGYFVKLAE